MIVTIWPSFISCLMTSDALTDILCAKSATLIVSGTCTSCTTASVGATKVDAPLPSRSPRRPPRGVRQPPRAEPPSLRRLQRRALLRRVVGPARRQLLGLDRLLVARLGSARRRRRAFRARPAFLWIVPLMPSAHRLRLLGLLRDEHRLRRVHHFADRRGFGLGRLRRRLRGRLPLLLLGIDVGRLDDAQRRLRRLRGLLAPRQPRLPRTGACRSRARGLLRQPTRARSAARLSRARSAAACARSRCSRSSRWRRTLGQLVFLTTQQLGGSGALPPRDAPARPRRSPARAAPLAFPRRRTACRRASRRCASCAPRPGSCAPCRSRRPA